MNTDNKLILIGLDLGFGDVKISVSVDSEKDSTRKRILTKYPTAIAYARDGIIGDLGADEKKYVFNGKNYFVGSSALQCRDVFSTRDIDFLMTYSPLLAFVAIEKSICSSFGLDVENFSSCKKNLCLGMPLAQVLFAG